MRTFLAFLILSLPLLSQEMCGAPPRDTDLVQVGPTAVKVAPAGNWSNPATWPGGTVPATGSAVVIPAGKEITLDVSPPHLASLILDGTLKVAAKPINLTAGYILVRSTGKFIAGTATKPFANYLTITLTGTDRQATTMGGRVFGVMGGGVVELIGKVPLVNWTMLANGKTADKGSNTLTLEVAPGWKTGDQIIITTTDFDYLQTEKRSIRSINGNVVTLNAALSYLHYGVITQVNHELAGVPTTIDERAEVGLLTHYIKIQGAQGIPGVEDSETNGYGGHMMVMDETSVARLQGVEFTNMGQRGILGRYPMHWHNVNDGGTNSYMRHCSTHRSFNRGTTIHKTNKVALTENVIYDTTGHGVFIEDGKETGNVFTRNLVASVHFSPMDLSWDVGASRSRINGKPSAFWITNPNNTFIGNVAAGVTPGGFGFWYDLHNEPRPGSISQDPNYHPNRQPFGVFRGNRAHSIPLTYDGFLEGAWGVFFETIHSEAPIVVEDFTSFKIQSGQMWATAGTQFIFKGCKLAGDNAVFNQHTLRESLAIGRTSNPVLKDPNDWQRNFNLANYDTSIGRNALIGYDFIGHADRSVLGNYRGVFRLRGDNDQGGRATDCVFLNDGTYRTYFIGNVENLTAEQAERSMFTMDNVEDSFGNGAPGLFTYSELFTDSNSRKAAQGAKGIEPTDALAWWSPFLEAEVATFGIRHNPGTPTYQVSLQPNGSEKTFVAVQRSDESGGVIQRTAGKFDLMHKVSFSGQVSNVQFEITLIDATAANEGRYLILSFPASTSEPSFSADYPIVHVTSKEAFDAANSIAVHKTESALNIKLPASQRRLVISGYTLP